MLIYKNTKNGFQNDWDDGVAIDIIRTELLKKMSLNPGEPEEKSWRNSLAYMRNVMNDPRIPDDAGVALEYNLPLTGKRVDFMISGFDSDGHGSVVIIELKQWSKLSAVDGQDAIVKTEVGRGLHEVPHPAYQAWSYAMMIKDFNTAVQKENIGLKPCAYLHNYIRHDPDPVDAPQYREYTQDTPVFDHRQQRKLADFIAQGIIRGDNCETLFRIENGGLRPSKSLQNSIASMMKGNREFVLIDEQKTVFERILYEAKLSQKSGKRVIIVEGGPGTGKSVVAINLLAELIRLDLFVQYVSKNSAPRYVFEKKLKGDMRKSSIDNLFRGSGTYVSSAENSCHVLIVDEAHRLNYKSGMVRSKGENQIKEIIRAARCSVFFIDEAQRVTIYDIGSVNEIKFQAKLVGAQVTQLRLPSQFRCNGSDGYLAWIDDVLGIRKTANKVLTGFDFRVMDSPRELFLEIAARNGDNRARVVAGYCWEWKKKNRSDPNAHDIKIDDFEMSWNLDNSHTWAIDPESISQAGCIHTCQGLEFDYVGVIIGADLRYDEDNRQVITDFHERATSDKSLSGIKKIEKENPQKAQKIADPIIRNTYRALMTRGMKGCFVWCVDAKLNRYLRERAMSPG